MKVGTIKVKRHYMVAQILLDAASLLLLVVIFQATSMFLTQVEQMKRYMKDTPITFGWEKILPVFIWIVLAIAVVTVSIVLTYKNRKLPKKYKITENNAQKYYEIIITAISAIRLLSLLAIFDMMFMHQQYILLFSTNFWGVQIPCDALLIFIIIRFSMHRIHAIEPKPEAKEEKEIVEI